MSHINKVRKDIVEFLRYHEEHDRYYEFACEKTTELTASASALKALVVRWAEARAGNLANCSQAANCEISCDVALINGSVSRFLEGSEIGELARLTGGLKVLSACFESMSRWMVDVQKRSDNTFSLPMDNTSFNHLFIQQFVILNNEVEALHDLLFVGQVLRRVVGLIESIDFSSEVVRDDQTKQVSVLKLLLVASALVGGGANFGELAADLVRANESRWRDFEEKAAQLNLRLGDFR